jgi:two-component system cell cycle sensor histidine kinase/response regulator CckA
MPTAHHPTTDTAELLDRLPLSVFRLDREHRVVYANRWLCAQLGAEPTSVYGNSCPELGMPPDTVAAWRAALADTFATGLPGTFEFCSAHAGAPRLVEFRLHPEPEPDGAVSTVLVVALTVNEVARLRVALRESEELFRAFLDRAPVFAWLRDSSSRYVFVNKAYLDQFGLKPEDRLGKTPHDVWPAEVADAFRANDQRVLAGNEPIRVIEAAPGAGGVPREWLNVKFPFSGAGGERFIGGVGVDVTEQRAADARAAELAKLESLALLAAGAAHDFSNLLTAMMGHAALAEAQLAAHAPAAEHLRSVQEAGARAAELCHAMMAFAGRGGEPRDTDLTELVSEVVRLARPLVPAGVEVRLDLPARAVVRADPTHLRQVVLNLLTNAAEAIGPTGGTVVLALAIECARAVLSVSDTGCGMTPAVRARVFEPYFTTKPTGRGLGLAAVHGIVRTLSGTIEVESTPGAGTVFRVALPLCSEQVRERD